MLVIHFLSLAHRFVDEVLPRYVRLPLAMGGGRMKQYFKDKALNFHDAHNFFSGLGLYILSFLLSLKPEQREASKAFLDAVRTQCA